MPLDQLYRVMLIWYFSNVKSPFSAVHVPHIILFSLKAEKNQSLTGASQPA